jgi:hypothetical protein
MKVFIFTALILKMQNTNKLNPLEPGRHDIAEILLKVALKPN